MTSSALLLDDDRAGLEVLILIGIGVLLKSLQAREVDLGLRGVIDAAVQIAMGMGGVALANSRCSMALTYPQGVARNHRQRRWPVRRFAVVELDAAPLRPGDGLLAVRGGDPRDRVFPDPTLPSRWLVKRVGDVRGTGLSAAFEACSDNPQAPGVVDSRQFAGCPQPAPTACWALRRRDG